MERPRLTLARGQRRARRRRTGHGRPSPGGGAAGTAKAYALGPHGAIMPAGSDCARTLRDRHRPGGACHSPAGARLILQDVGKPCCTEAGGEAVDGDLHFVAMAD